MAVVLEANLRRIAFLPEFHIDKVKITNCPPTGAMPP